jgi:F0F1-type ATP synthase delta subunit
MKELQEILNPLEPVEALAALKPQLKEILSHLDEEARVDFVTGLIDEAGGDKVSSMVHL